MRNIIQLLDLVREPETKTPAFYFELVKDSRSQNPLPDFEWFRHSLLHFPIAQSSGIRPFQLYVMHWDVKPHNVMIDLETKTLRLIDWDWLNFITQLSHIMFVSLHLVLQGPELLVDFQEYDYSLICGFGLHVRWWFFMKDTFFHGRDNDDQLFKIVKVLGNERIHPIFEPNIPIKLDSKFKELRLSSN